MLVFMLTRIFFHSFLIFGIRSFTLTISITLVSYPQNLFNTTCGFLFTTCENNNIIVNRNKKCPQCIEFITKQKANKSK